MLAEGALLFERAARRARGDSPGWRTRSAQAGERAGERWANAAQAAQAAPAVQAVLARYPLRELITRSARYPVIVHRPRALYGAWYEFFPRSEGVEIDPMGRREPRSGTFRSAARRLDAIADMGFDVVYL